VRTGSQLRQLFLTPSEYVEVFLISGSPEERELDVEEIITVKDPAIVLCSLQYRKDVTDSIKYFTDRGYFSFFHWLNPGHSDPEQIDDDLNIIDTIVSSKTLLGVRDGKCSADSRVGEMRDFIYGWAKSRGLLKKA
jgi:hypothetical protein